MSQLLTSLKYAVMKIDGYNEYIHMLKSAKNEKIYRRILKNFKEFHQVIKLDRVYFSQVSAETAESNHTIKEKMVIFAYLDRMIERFIHDLPVSENGYLAESEKVKDLLDKYLLPDDCYEVLKKCIEKEF